MQRLSDTPFNATANVKSGELLGSLIVVESKANPNATSKWTYSDVDDTWSYESILKKPNVQNAQLMLDEKIAMFNAPPPKPYTQGQYDAVVESQIKEGVL